MKALRGLDALLRRCYRIYEFSRDEECLLRLAVHTNGIALVLGDGTRLVPGDRIGELHLWNEHVPPMPREGPDLAWGLTFQRRLAHSLRLLAACASSEPALQDVRAFRGELVFGDRHGLIQIREMAERWGFEVMDQDRAGGLRRCFVDFWKNLYTLGLIWTFNPASLRGKSVGGLQRNQFWISRRTLMGMFGPPLQSCSRADRR